MSQALSKLGRNDEAWSLLEEATTIVSSNGERYYEAELYRLKGELLLKKSEFASAEQSFKRSLEIAKSRKAISLQFRTEMSLARLSSV